MFPRSFAAFEDEAFAGSAVAQVHRAEVYADETVDQGGDTVRRLRGTIKIGTFRRWLLDASESMRVAQS